MGNPSPPPSTGNPHDRSHPAFVFRGPVPAPVKETWLPPVGSCRRIGRPIQILQMHLTLVFMGEVPASDLAQIVAVGDRSWPLSGPRSGSPWAHSGCFPDQRNPRVLFVFHAHSEGLVPLAACLQEELTAWADPKPFRPHLNPARKKGDRRPPFHALPISSMPGLSIASI